MSNICLGLYYSKKLVEVNLRRLELYLAKLNLLNKSKGSKGGLKEGRVQEISPYIVEYMLKIL